MSPLGQMVERWILLRASITKALTSLHYIQAQDARSLLPQPRQGKLISRPFIRAESHTNERTLSRTVLVTDCNTSVGCGIRNSDAKGFGPAFNANGGGYYAMERTNSAISVWFWERSGSVPSDISTHGSTVDTSNWGQPTAIFPNTDCDIASHFDANHIIINLTFCGQWAGSTNVYAASGCPSTCVGK